jgi:GntR family transcriptional regulator / MocR family aminotransferase
VDLHVSLDGRRDLSGQIYRQIRAAIVDGLLRPGQALPSTRELAGRLAVSRNTVGTAYDRLVAEGYLAGRAGVGTYVSAQLRERSRAEPARADAPLRPRPVWDSIIEPPDLSAAEPEFDFRTGIPDARQFPFATLRGLLASQLRGTAVRAGAHIDPAGDPGLREAVARHLGVSRAVQASAADVLVTSGSQQAADLVARVLLEPGDLVAVEDPGYPPPRSAFTAAGARVVGVPVDADGLVVDALPAHARLVYVTPSHQWPLGMSMSLPRRLALLDWAERTGAVIVEDDYDSEFRYAGRPVEPLQSLDHSGRVLYLGSFSKVMLPTLRLGFLIAPRSLHSALRKAKWVADWHTALPMQAALARFIDDGLLARQIRRLRKIYTERHHRLTTALHSDFIGSLAPIPSVAGLHLAAWLLPGAAGSDDVAVVRAARSVGVAVQPLSVYAVTVPPRPGLVLGYGAIPTERIGEGLRRLKECIERGSGVEGGTGVEGGSGVAPGP